MSEERNLLRNQVVALEKKLEDLQTLMADFQLAIAQDANIEEELRRLDDALISMRAEELTAAKIACDFTAAEDDQS
jgi:hypothetical protein